MNASSRKGLVRNFASLVLAHWPEFPSFVIHDVLKMKTSGSFLRKEEGMHQTDQLCMFHGPSYLADFCRCLFADVSTSDHISLVPISRFVDHIKAHTVQTHGIGRTCTECHRRVLPTDRVFIYNDVVFRTLVITKILKPGTLSLTTPDLPRFDDELEMIHLLYAYLLSGNSRRVLETMSSNQIETAWTVIRLNLENLRLLKLTGTSRWTNGNLKWPVLYTHNDDERCTCAGTPIENCCRRFDFEDDVVMGISKSHPWTCGLFFISMGRAIHHLAFHTKAISGDIPEERMCLLCHQKIVFDNFCSVNMEVLTELRETTGRNDAMIVDSNADSEADVEDHSPKIIFRSKNSPIRLKRTRVATPHTTLAISEPVFKKPKTALEANASVVRPRIAMTSKLPKVTPEIVEAMFAMAFEDDILRKNLDQWLPWIARSRCQPADRMDNRSWEGTHMSSELVTSDGFVRLNHATDLSSVSIYIPRSTQAELDAEYNKVIQQEDVYTYSIARGTTRIFCRNVTVKFPYNFDFSRVFIASSVPRAISPVLDRFVTEKTGGYRSLVIADSMGATEIMIEPFVLSRFDDDDDDHHRDDVSVSQETTRELSHTIQIFPIQDNLEILGGANLTRPSPDIVLVTPHPFKICYPTPNTAVFACGQLTANGTPVIRPKGYGIDPVAFERLAADLGIVAPSVPRRDIAIPLNPNASVFDDYDRNNDDSLQAHKKKMTRALGHTKNPLRFVPTPSLMDMLFWPPGSGFVVRFDSKTVRGHTRKGVVGVGADGITKQDERIEIQACPMYKDPKTGSVVVTYDGRWLLQFVPDNHADGAPVVSYTVSTNLYLWDFDRTPVNTAADFVVAGGPRVSFFNADDDLHELRSCIDPVSSVGKQLRNMERIGNDDPSAVVQTPQLKAPYSIVRIYTRSFLTMLDLNFVRDNATLYSKEMLATRHLDIYWRAAVPGYVLFEQDGTRVSSDQLPALEVDMMRESVLDQAGVRLIVRKAGFYSINDILDAPIFMTAEQELFATTGRSLFAPDSPMLLPVFVLYGKVHLACNSLESVSRLGQFEKFQIDRRNMMQMVLASTIAKWVTNHRTLPFAPIQDHAALRYTLVAHTSTNIHRHYPWLAGIFPWLTFDLSIPLDPAVLRKRHIEEVEEKAAALGTAIDAPKKKQSRSSLNKYTTCVFCKMLTIPITSKRKPTRHSPHMCPLFFEYSNSERALLEFALVDEARLGSTFKEKLLYIPKEGVPSVKGYRLRIDVFKIQRNKLRVSFGSRLSSLVKCESTNFGPVYAEELKIKYSSVCIPERLPWVTLLTSFCGNRMIDSVLRDGGITGFMPSKDDIIALEKEPESVVPHAAPTSELREIFYNVHQKLDERLRAEAAAATRVSISSSSLSSSSEADGA